MVTKAAWPRTVIDTWVPTGSGIRTDGESVAVTFLTGLTPLNAAKEAQTKKRRIEKGRMVIYRVV